MLENYFRTFFQTHLFDHIANKMPSSSANKITYSGMIAGILAALAVGLNFLWLATILLLTSGFLDTLDGSVARMHNNSNSKGCVLDIFSDRIVELAIMIGLFAVDPANRGWLVLMMLGSCYLCITSFLVVGIFVPNQTHKAFHYSPGLIERMETFIFFIFMIWLPHYFMFFAILFSALVLLTSFVRLKQFFSHMNYFSNK